VNKRDHKVLARHKRKLQKRLARKFFTDQSKSMFGSANIHYELTECNQAIGFGGIGAIHTMVRRLHLDAAINRDLSLLKVHVPYFESDHVLNLAYNVITGGTCLEDMDRLCDDTSYTLSLAAERIPDPTTAGDFL
jgi:hypothetical protein